MENFGIYDDEEELEDAIPTHEDQKKITDEADASQSHKEDEPSPSQDKNEGKKGGAKKKKGQGKAVDLS